IRLELLEEAVHLVAHVEDVFPPRQIIAEHHDMLERGVHHLQFVLDVLQALTSLLFHIVRDELHFSRPFLLGSSARGIFKWVAPRLPGEEKNIYIPSSPESAGPLYLFL